jgi:hypothetical protein
MGEMRNAYKVFVEVLNGRELRRHRIELKETGWEGVDWMCLVQGRDQWRVLVGLVMNLRVT